MRIGRTNHEDIRSRTMQTSDQICSAGRYCDDLHIERARKRLQQDAFE